MAIKKSELYSSLWSSCDELRGGMDASQYKDYVLMMLFIKYVSDKFSGQPYAAVTVPEGSSFTDMVALKGTSTIGDDINKKIIAPLANANKLSNVPDFNDSEKLGSGKEKVVLLTNLIAIFENKALDFSKNKAEGDDILGDAYEYLMRHFATESGKSKGQFYTPAEVSRIMASIIGINNAKTTGTTTVYDPTCGSGSLLLKVAAEANSGVTLYGQEKDGATSGLARMNMILHNNPTAEIKQGNTLANPLFLDENDSIKTHDYVVANPPFSDKSWNKAVDTTNDPHNRFKEFGVPPNKNGDYAYLLHIIRSLKSRGKGACILPHGVLFRGNAEAGIREAIIRKGLIKGIIGLPANLFYGTGIPACIILIDKEGSQNRKGIFMVDAGKGFIKEGNKNRLREMDLHKIIDVFNKQTEIEGYSRIITFDKIEKNEFNLNIPRYIDSSETEDLQDIEAHLLGDIPTSDIDDLQQYWQIFPKIRDSLFKTAERSSDYLTLQVTKDTIKQTIFEHAEFIQYSEKMDQVFNQWCKNTTEILKSLEVEHQPKQLIHDISENLLISYTNKALLNKYDVFQHLMNYWFEVMQDDCYLISADGWKAETYRIIVENKKGDEVDKGWTCDLIPKILVINRYYSEEQKAINILEAQLETQTSQLNELEEEYSGEEAALNNVSSKAEANSALQEYIDLAWSSIEPESFNKYEGQSTQLERKEAKLVELKNQPEIESLKNNRGTVVLKAINDRLKQVIEAQEETCLTHFIEQDKAIKALKKDIKELRETAQELIDTNIEINANDEYLAEIIIVRQYLKLTQDKADTRKSIKEAQVELDNKLLAHYPTLSEDQIKQLVVDDKWMTVIEKDIQSEMDRISQRLSQRIKELAERYEISMPQQTKNIKELEDVVNVHLEKMGFVWK